MGGNMGMGMLSHVGGRGKEAASNMLSYPRAPPANTFLRQSPSPSAASPAMPPGPSPASMGKYIREEVEYYN